MEESLRTLLLGTAPLAALVGQRVDWGLRAQGGGMPAVALHLISGVPQLKMRGAAEWSKDRVQADCWGRTFKAARDAAAAIVGVTNGVRLTTAAGVQLRLFVLDRRTDSDADEQGPVFRTSLDLQVWHNP